MDTVHVSGLRGIGSDDFHAVVRIVALASSFLTIRVTDVVAVLLVKLGKDESRVRL